MRLQHVVLSVCIPCTTFTALAGAVVIHVEPDGSGDAPTIAAAYAMANSGDDIQLAPGTYFEHDIVMKSLVDVRSDTDDPATTIVDAQGLGRCLDGGGVTGAPVIRGITFQNGSHLVEGGILLAGQGGTGGGHNAHYVNCVFRNGTAPTGGAVVTRASPGSAPTFNGCVFESNRATVSDGGAIWSRGVGSAQMCEFRNNEAARHGGAVHSQKTFNWGFRADNCAFDGNSAGGDGGAFSSAGTDDFYGSSIVGCSFSENVATHGGAAILNHYDVVQYSTFLHNEATQDGGALYLSGIQPDEDYFANYASNIFARNTAGSEGGAVYFLGSTSVVYLNFNTFVANGAPSGGHFWTNANPVVRSCIFAFATEGGAGEGSQTVSPTCTDVFGNGGGDFTGALVNGESIPSNFSADPLFCDIAGSNFTLQFGSPCLPPLPSGCSTRIGALGQGCSVVSVEASVETDSWGSIKARYR